MPAHRKGWPAICEAQRMKISVDHRALAGHHVAVHNREVARCVSPSSQPSVLIIDENRIRAAIIEGGLREAGHDRVTILSDMQGLMRQIVELSPDVIVINLENPNRDRLEHLLQMSRLVDKPIAMFVDQSDSAMMEAAIDAGVSAYVVDGLRKERVKAIMDMAIARFNAYSRLKSELEGTKQALEDRRRSTGPRPS